MKKVFKLFFNREAGYYLDRVKYESECVGYVFYCKRIFFGISYFHEIGIYSKIMELEAVLRTYKMTYTDFGITFLDFLKENSIKVTQI